MLRPALRIPEGKVKENARVGVRVRGCVVEVGYVRVRVRDKAWKVGLKGEERKARKGGREREKEEVGRENKASEAGIHPKFLYLRGGAWVEVFELLVFGCGEGGVGRGVRRVLTGLGLIFVLVWV